MGELLKPSPSQHQTWSSLEMHGFLAGVNLQEITMSSQPHFKSSNFQFSLMRSALKPGEQGELLHNPSVSEEKVMELAMVILVAHFSKKSQEHGTLSETLHGEHQHVMPTNTQLCTPKTLLSMTGSWNRCNKEILIDNT